MKFLGAVFALSGFVCGIERITNIPAKYDSLPFFKLHYGPWLDALNGFVAANYPEFPGTFEVALRPTTCASVQMCPYRDCDCPMIDVLNNRFDEWQYRFTEAFPGPPAPVYNKNKCFHVEKCQNGALVDTITGFYPETMEAFSRKITEPLLQKMRSFLYTYPICGWEPQIKVKFPASSASSPMFSHRYWSVSGPATDKHIWELVDEYQHWDNIREKLSVDPAEEDALCAKVEREAGLLTMPESVKSTTMGEARDCVTENRNGSRIVQNIIDRKLAETYYDDNSDHKREKDPAKMEVEQEIKPSKEPLRFLESCLGVVTQILSLSINLLGAYLIAVHLGGPKHLTGRKLSIKSDGKRLASVVVWSIILSCISSLNTVATGRELLAMGFSLLMSYYTQSPSGHIALELGNECASQRKFLVRIIKRLAASSSSKLDKPLGSLKPETPNYTISRLGTQTTKFVNQVFDLAEAEDFDDDTIVALLEAATPTRVISTISADRKLRSKVCSSKEFLQKENTVTPQETTPTSRESIPTSQKHTLSVQEGKSASQESTPTLRKCVSTFDQSCTPTCEPCTSISKAYVFTVKDHTPTVEPCTSRAPSFEVSAYKVSTSEAPTSKISIFELEELEKVNLKECNQSDKLQDFRSTKQSSARDCSCEEFEIL